MRALAKDEYVLWVKDRELSFIGFEQCISLFVNRKGVFDMHPAVVARGGKLLFCGFWNLRLPDPVE